MRGNKYSQVFTNDVDYVKVIPMKTKSEAGNALSTLFEDVGMPTHIHTDGVKEMTLGTWKKVREQHGGVKQTRSEPYSPWQNRA